MEHLSGNDRFRFVEADICDPEKMADAVEGADWVFHFAGLADIVPSIQQPLRYHRANVDGSAIVLEAARQAGVGRFLYAASGSCYGADPETPTAETAPIRPAYPYALTKYLGEQMALHWGQVYRMPVVSLRLFNVYGPRSRTTGAYGAVFGVFLAQKLAEKPLTVVGDGTQSRDFTFADNSRFRAATGWAPQVSFDEGVGILLDNIEALRDAPVWTPDSIADATADWFKYLSD